MGNGNGELEKGTLSLPPIDAVYRFAATGMDNIGLPEEETKGGMSSHSIWPFVAAALEYSGTKGPCFFLLRTLKPGEIGQLSKQLASAAAHSNKLQKAFSQYGALLDAAANTKPVTANSPLAGKLIGAVTARDKKRESLADTLAMRIKGSSGKSGVGYSTLLAEVQKADSLATPLDSIRNGIIKMGSDIFPALRLLIDSANEREDLTALGAILADNAMQAVSTNARKAIMEIDYSFFGPQISA